MTDLKSDGSFFQRNRLQTRYWPEDFRAGKKIAQFVSQLLRFFD